MNGYKFVSYFEQIFFRLASLETRNTKGKNKSPFVVAFAIAIARVSKEQSVVKVLFFMFFNEYVREEAYKEIKLNGQTKHTHILQALKTKHTGTRICFNFFFFGFVKKLSTKWLLMQAVFQIFESFSFGCFL